ncbi:NADP-dependent aldehyde dehydrogenase [Motilibacter rhizosphaerae]|uniref:NADP-dependent aldehyde dehydrogenase n=1 Tax=Motilibacter rhizosphaerae TaxID=598652 RepID=A0A4Q7NB08_9ACTN|nr:aldehyde dehydrogenase family protein [Motilibacter rhizosphaerae]RZS80033.1 NADP-dependent aldehyde dehydrogenase [Motilibacter rhizosphaerae]
MTDGTSDETTEEQLDAVLAAAAAAAPQWAASDPATRRRLLEALAVALEGAVDELVALAQEETALSTARLSGEVRRTAYQLRFAADVVADGGYLDAVRDEPSQDAGLPAPRPDLRRVLLPRGPALVFEAGNFPFAFGLLGTDTAAGLAAGCPVVVKVHPGHPRTSLRQAELARGALDAAGFPAGLLGSVVGGEPGVRALRDPRVRVATFTGSLRGGLALQQVAQERAEPIPFYGELGSVNPVVVTAAAAERRTEEVAKGLLDSVSGSGGQLCTKPGLVLVPAGPLPDLLARLVAERAPERMLTPDGRDRFREELAERRSLPGVEVLGAGRPEAADDPSAQQVLLLTTSAERAAEQLEQLAQEVFGPAAVVVAYDDAAALEELVPRLPGSLTGTVQYDPEDPEDVARAARVAELLAARVGRVVFNGWPTGVSVALAMHHGGPPPASTDDTTTSVGGASLRRFLRPVVFQGAPELALPPALRGAPA